MSNVFNALAPLFLVFIFGCCYFVNLYHYCLWTVKNLHTRIILIFLLNIITVMLIWSFCATMWSPVGKVPDEYKFTRQQHHVLLKASTEDEKDELLEWFCENKNLLLHTCTPTGSVRYCSTCMHIKPDRAHHCATCKVCFLKMDHHCPWVNNCIGYMNYKNFLLLIFYACLFCFYFVVSTVRHMIRTLDNATLWSNVPIGLGYCSTCMHIKPDRAHHCATCKVCFLKMDHHCPWVNNCIGYMNYKNFLLLIFYACLFCFYFVVSTVRHMIRTLDNATLWSNVPIGLGYCSTCMHIKPDRAHHCATCKVCFLKMDHHCPWVNNCIGYMNYKNFLLLIFYACLFCFYFVVSTVRHMIRTLDNATLWSNVPIGLGFGFTVVMGMVTFGFLCYHLYLVARNETTLENVHNPTFNEDDLTFDLGNRQNYVEVFGDRWYLWFLPVFSSMGCGYMFLVARK